jgi:Protein of unknown function (DUF3618)
MTSSGPGKKATTEPPAGPAALSDGAVSGDEQELRQQIEQTREQLGATVEQLAAKTDVTARARAKAAQAAGRVKGSTAQLQARSAVVWEKAPEPLRRTVVKGASTAKQRRVPLAVAAAALVAGYLALRWLRKR